MNRELTIGNPPPWAFRLATGAACRNPRPARFIEMPFEMINVPTEALVFLGAIDRARAPPPPLVCASQPRWRANPPRRSSAAPARRSYSRIRRRVPDALITDL